MAAPQDRVYLLKRESTARGGDNADETEYPSLIDPLEDAPSARGIFLQPVGGPEDENVYLTRDATNMLFRDTDHASEWELKRLFKQYGAGEDAGQHDLVSATYNQKLRVSPVAVAGDYVVMWFAEVTTDADLKAVQARVQIDDTTTLTEVQIRPPVASAWTPISGFARVTLTAATHDIDIDWLCLDTGTYTASIRKARILCVRVG